MNKILSASLLAASLTLPMVAGAATKIYTLKLNGAQEVPANLSPADGDAQITVDDTADTISFSIVALNLQGSFLNAHIHGQAPAGANTGVVFGLLANADSAGPLMVGPFVVPNSYQLLGSNKDVPVAFPTLADDINAKPWLYYVNLHTSAFPGGEIRGQLAPVPEASTLAMMFGGLGLVGFMAARRRRTA